MTMSNPGAGAFMSMPGQARANIHAPAPTKRVGLLRMPAGSDHMITVVTSEGPRGVYCRALPRDAVPKAKTVFICLNPACTGRSWPTYAAMTAAHPEPSVMAKRVEAHVYGLWSEDPVDPKNKDAGVVGLIAPQELQRDEG